MVIAFPQLDNLKSKFGPCQGIKLIELYALTKSEFSIFDYPAEEKRPQRPRSGFSPARVLYRGPVVLLNLVCDFSKLRLATSAIWIQGGYNVKPARARRARAMHEFSPPKIYEIPRATGARARCASSLPGTRESWDSGNHHTNF